MFGYSINKWLYHDWLIVYSPYCLPKSHNFDSTATNGSEGHIWVFPEMVVPPFHAPKWSLLVGKPMVVGETYHFRKPPYPLRLWLWTCRGSAQTNPPRWTNACTAVPSYFRRAICLKGPWWKHAKMELPNFGCNCISKDAVMFCFFN